MEDMITIINNSPIYIYIYIPKEFCQNSEWHYWYVYKVINIWRVNTTWYGHTHIRWSYSSAWLRQWLAAWRHHQAITWTNVDYSFVRFFNVHLRGISQWVPQPQLFSMTNLESILVKLTMSQLTHLPLVPHIVHAKPLSKSMLGYFCQ